MLRAVWYGFPICSHFCSEADMLCLWDRWGFSWEMAYNSGGVSICVKGSGGLQVLWSHMNCTLVTKMGMCY